MNTQAKLMSQCITAIVNNDRSHAEMLLKELKGDDGPQWFAYMWQGDSNEIARAAALAEATKRDPSKVLGDSFMWFGPQIITQLQHIKCGRWSDPKDAIKSLLLSNKGENSAGILHYAVAMEAEELVDLIIDQAKSLNILKECLTATNSFGFSPIKIAMSGGYENSGKLLDEAKKVGVDLKAHFEEEMFERGLTNKTSLLHQACANSKSAEGLKFLLKTLEEEGVEVTKLLKAENSSGHLPLHNACLNTNPGVLKAYLEAAKEAGLDLGELFAHVTSFGGETPMAYAARNGNSEVLKAYLEAVKEAGLDVKKLIDCVDVHGHSALFYANEPASAIALLAKGAEHAEFSARVASDAKFAGCITAINIVDSIIKMQSISSDMASGLGAEYLKLIQDRLASSLASEKVTDSFIEYATKSSVEVPVLASIYHDFIATKVASGEVVDESAAISAELYLHGGLGTGAESICDLAGLPEFVGRAVADDADYDLGLYIGLNGDVVADAGVDNSGFTFNLTGDAGGYSL